MIQLLYYCIIQCDHLELDLTLHLKQIVLFFDVESDHFSYGGSGTNTPFKDPLDFF